MDVQRGVCGGCLCLIFPVGDGGRSSTWAVALHLPLTASLHVDRAFTFIVDTGVVQTV